MVPKPMVIATVKSLSGPDSTHFPIPMAVRGIVLGVALEVVRTMVRGKARERLPAGLNAMADERAGKLQGRAILEAMRPH
jgi:hypothetical protein